MNIELEDGSLNGSIAAERSWQETFAQYESGAIDLRELVEKWLADKPVGFRFKNSDISPPDARQPRFNSRAYHPEPSRRDYHASHISEVTQRLKTRGLLGKPFPGANFWIVVRPVDEFCQP
jgi:hypothetical protein